MTKHTATEKELEEIHAGFTKWCLLVLDGVPLLDSDGRAVMKEDGTPWLIPPSAAHMSTIRQFLKDNGIDSAKTPGSPLSRISELPVFDDKDGIRQQAH